MAAAEAATQQARVAPNRLFVLPTQTNWVAGSSPAMVIGGGDLPKPRT
jgi:hypothetical protein